MKGIPLWVWGALGLLLAFGVWSYGNGRVSEALALARADSLLLAYARHESLEISRDSARLEVHRAVQAFDLARDSLVGVASTAESRSRANLGRLAAILEDSASRIPDTVRIVVREAIAGLEDQVRVCQVQLETCAQTRVRLEGRIAIDSSSIAEKDSLLRAYDLQLEDALRNRARPVGPLVWIVRGLAVLKIVEIVTGRD